MLYRRPKYGIKGMLIIKFHLGFGRMNVDINSCWVHLQKNEIARKLIQFNKTLKGRNHRVMQIRTFDKSFIDKKGPVVF